MELGGRWGWAWTDLGPQRPWLSALSSTLQDLVVLSWKVKAAHLFLFPAPWKFWAGCDLTGLLLPAGLLIGAPPQGGASPPIHPGPGRVGALPHPDPPRPARCASPRCLSCRKSSCCPGSPICMSRVVRRPRQAEPSGQ